MISEWQQWNDLSFNGESCYNEDWLAYYDLRQQLHDYSMLA
jgi:hypothetical protein